MCKEDGLIYSLYVFARRKLYPIYNFFDKQYAKLLFCLKEFPQCKLCLLLCVMDFHNFYLLRNFS